MHATAASSLPGSSGSGGDTAALKINKHLHKNQDEADEEQDFSQCDLRTRIRLLQSKLHPTATTSTPTQRVASRSPSPMKEEDEDDALSSMSSLSSASSSSSSASASSAASSFAPTPPPRFSSLRSQHQQAGGESRLRAAIVAPRPQQQQQQQPVAAPATTDTAANCRDNRPIPSATHSGDNNRNRKMPTRTSGAQNESFVPHATLRSSNAQQRQQQHHHHLKPIDKLFSQQPGCYGGGALASTTSGQKDGMRPGEIVSSFLQQAHANQFPAPAANQQLALPSHPAQIAARSCHPLQQQQQQAAAVSATANSDSASSQLAARLQRTNLQQAQMCQLNALVELPQLSLGARQQPITKAIQRQEQLKQQQLQLQLAAPLGVVAAARVAQPQQRPPPLPPTRDTNALGNPKAPPSLGSISSSLSSISSAISSNSSSTTTTSTSAAMLPLGGHQVGALHRPPSRPPPTVPSYRDAATRLGLVQVGDQQRASNWPLEERRSPISNSQQWGGGQGGRPAPLEAASEPRKVSTACFCFGRSLSSRREMAPRAASSKPLACALGARSTTPTNCSLGDPRARHLTRVCQSARAGQVVLLKLCSICKIDSWRRASERKPYQECQHLSGSLVMRRISVVAFVVFVLFQKVFRGERECKTEDWARNRTPLVVVVYVVACE